MVFGGQHSPSVGMTSNSRISVSANGNSVRTATPFLIQAPMDSKQLYQLTASLLAQREEKEKAKETYSYRVKIINQKKKNDFQTRRLQYCDRFSTIHHLKEKLIEEFDNQVPAISSKFQVGYFEGRQSSKIWLCINDDIDAMYKGQSTSEILLWCDARTAEDDEEDLPVSANKRSKQDNGPLAAGKRAQLSEKTQQIVTDLQKQHGDQYSMVQYRLWARMITAGIHSMTDNPPAVPAISGTLKKSSIKKKGENSPPKVGEGSSLCIGMSPGRKADIRSKYLEQLSSKKIV